MSEKLDGVRAYWDGQQFLSRQGNVYHAPDWFLEGLPSVPLDGELWLDRKAFQRFEALGGEGLMLRQPGSTYVAGRSSTLLKVKTFHDAEATVIGHEPGKGRHAGRLGALAVQLPNGKQFSVGTGFSDKQRENPPQIGSLIQFRYQEFSDAGIPRFPSYVGQRLDEPWSAAARRSPPSIAAKRSQAASDVIVIPSTEPKQTTSSATLQVVRSSKIDPRDRMECGVEPPHSKARCFEFVDAMSNKFWEITLSGSDVTTRWGRIGNDGQTKTKSFGSDDKAKAEYDKLVSEKSGKGYVEVAQPRGE